MFTKHKIICLIALGLVLVYGQIFFRPFIGDDEWGILQDPQIRNWRNIPTLFLGTWQQGKVYRPLVLLSITLEYHLWQTNPIGYRLTSILWHVLLVYLVCNLLLTLGIDSKLTWTATILYAFHPIHSQVIQVAATRGDTMCACFCIMSLLYYLKRQRLVSPLSLLFFVCSLLTKEIGLALIGILFLYEWTIKDNSKIGTPITALLPYIGVAVLYLFWRTSIVGEISSDAYNAFYGISWLARFCTMMLVFVLYIGICFVPIRLGYDYQFNDFPLLESLGQWQAWPGLLGVAGYITAMFIAARSNKIFAFWLGWFAIFLLPVSNVVFPTPIIMGERFLTLPLVAFSVGIAGLLRRFGLAPGNPQFSQNNRRHLQYCFMLIIVIYSGIIARELIWRGHAQHWRKLLSVSPNSYFARMKLGYIAFKNNDLQQALYYYRQATARRSYLSNAPMAPNNCGKIYLKLAEKKQALIFFRLAIKRFEKSQLPVQPYIVEIYYQVGILYVEQKNWQRAQYYFRKVITWQNLADAHMLQKSLYYLACTHVRGGEYATAIYYYRQLLDFAPKYAPVHYDLAIIYWKIGKKKLSKIHRQQAMRLGLNFPAALQKIWQAHK